MMKRIYANLGATRHRARRDSNARPLAPEPPEAGDGQRPLA
jgi:hypothetical protein